MIVALITLINDLEPKIRSWYTLRGSVNYLGRLQFHYAMLRHCLVVDLIPRMTPLRLPQETCQTAGKTMELFAIDAINS